MAGSRSAGRRYDGDTAVVQAVAMLGNQNHHAMFDRLIVDCPLHGEALSNGLTGCGMISAAARRLAQTNTHEKQLLAASPNCGSPRYCIADLARSWPPRRRCRAIGTGQSQTKTLHIDPPQSKQQDAELSAPVRIANSSACASAIRQCYFFGPRVPGREGRFDPPPHRAQCRPLCGPRGLTYRSRLRRPIWLADDARALQHELPTQCTARLAGLALLGFATATTLRSN